MWKQKFFPWTHLYIPYKRKVLGEKKTLQDVTCTALNFKEAAWPSGRCIRLAIQWSLVRVPLWSLTEFVHSCPELKSLATLVNSQLVASFQFGFVTILCSFQFVCFIILKSPIRGKDTFFKSIYQYDYNYYYLL